MSTPRPADALDPIEPLIASMASAIVEVPEVVGVVLGGSRARGDAVPGSDVDLGLYVGQGVDRAELSRLASSFAVEPVEIGGPGSWGPWVDSGAWLSCRVPGLDEPRAVDWILRDVSRVADQVDRAVRGEYAFHVQPGHPLGFLDISYAGELAIGRFLADPSGRLRELRDRVTPYPPALAEAFEVASWEAGFLLDAAVKGAKKGDVAFVALCLSRASMLQAHVLSARAGRWVTNEKGLVPGVGRLVVSDTSGTSYADRVAGILGNLGTTPSELAAAIEAARGVLVAVPPAFPPG